MQIVMMPIDEIKPYDKNPRKNDEAVDYVANSIKEFGFRQPIVIDANNEIVAGHTRHKAAKKLKLKEVPCIMADDLSPERIQAYRLADNKVGEIAEWDFKLLDLELDDLADLFDMSDFGFDLSEFEHEEVQEDDFDVDSVPDEPVAKLGQIWQLGEHRLMCGDSTSAEDVARLMNGELADMVFTDPPYGVARDKGFGGFGAPIARRSYEDDWDSEAPSQQAFDNIVNNSKRAIIWGGNYFTDKLPVGTFWIVWDKNNTMPTFGDCELAWTNLDRKSVKKYDITYNGLIGKEKERHHPTQKPVRLCAEVLQDFTSSEEIVLDLFGGSGSTLIACEQLDRKCYMMELSPKYVDVIIARWENLTGLHAEMIEDIESA